MKEILLIVYTLCGQPQHLTIVEGQNITLWKYSAQAIQQIANKYQSYSVSTAKLPLDKIDKGHCA